MDRILLAPAQSPLAANYDSLATVNPNSVCYGWANPGCLYSSAINYCSTCTVERNPSDCKLPIVGCLDERAHNFNPEATLQGSGVHECNFGGLDGCIDPAATNYNSKAEKQGTMAVHKCVYVLPRSRHASCTP